MGSKRKVLNVRERLERAASTARPTFGSGIGTLLTQQQLREQQLSEQQQQRGGCAGDGSDNGGGDLGAAVAAPRVRAVSARAHSAEPGVLRSRPASGPTTRVGSTWAGQPRHGAAPSGHLNLLVKLAGGSGGGGAAAAATAAAASADGSAAATAAAASAAAAAATAADGCAEGCAGVALEQRGTQHPSTPERPTPRHAVAFGADDDKDVDVCTEVGAAASLSAPTEASSVRQSRFSASPPGKATVQGVDARMQNTPFKGPGLPEIWPDDVELEGIRARCAIAAPRAGLADVLAEERARACSASCVPPARAHELPSDVPSERTHPHRVHVQSRPSRQLPPASLPLGDEHARDAHDACASTLTDVQVQAIEHAAAEKAAVDRLAAGVAIQGGQPAAAAAPAVPAAPAAAVEKVSALATSAASAASQATKLTEAAAKTSALTKSAASAASQETKLTETAAVVIPAAQAAAPGGNQRGEPAAAEAAHAEAAAACRLAFVSSRPALSDAEAPCLERSRASLPVKAPMCRQLGATAIADALEAGILEASGTTDRLGPAAGWVDAAGNEVGADGAKGADSAALPDSAPLLHSTKEYEAAACILPRAASAVDPVLLDPSFSVGRLLTPPMSTPERLHEAPSTSVFGIKDDERSCSDAMLAATGPIQEASVPTTSWSDGPAGGGAVQRGRDGLLPVDHGDMLSVAAGRSISGRFDAASVSPAPTAILSTRRVASGPSIGALVAAAPASLVVHQGRSGPQDARMVGATLASSIKQGTSALGSAAVAVVADLEHASTAPCGGIPPGQLSASRAAAAADIRAHTAPLASCGRGSLNKSPRFLQAQEQLLPSTADAGDARSLPAACMRRTSDNAGFWHGAEPHDAEAPRIGRSESLPLGASGLTAGSLPAGAHPPVGGSLLGAAALGFASLASKTAATFVSMRGQPLKPSSRRRRAAPHAAWGGGGSGSVALEHAPSVPLPQPSGALTRSLPAGPDSVIAACMAAVAVEPRQPCTSAARSDAAPLGSLSSARGSQTLVLARHSRVALLPQQSVVSERQSRRMSAGPHTAPLPQLPAFGKPGVKAARAVVVPKTSPALSLVRTPADQLVGSLALASAPAPPVLRTSPRRH